MYERHYNYSLSREKEKAIDEMFDKLGDIFEKEKTDKEIIKKYTQGFKNRALNMKKMDCFINEIGGKFKELAKKSLGELTIVVHDNSFTGFILLECTSIEYKNIEDIIEIFHILDDICILAKDSKVRIVVEQNLYDEMEPP